MIGHIQQTLFAVNVYTISLLIIAALFLLTSFSVSIKQSIMTPLSYLTVAWIILFGYKVVTGDNLYTDIAAFFSEEEESRYEKVMIDGREVIFDKYTNEVVKPAKN